MKDMNKTNKLTRQDFLRGIAVGTGTTFVGGCLTKAAGNFADTLAGSHDLDVWQRETDAVKPEIYRDYMLGNITAEGFPALERLEVSFAKPIVPLWGERIV